MTTYHLEITETERWGVWWSALRCRAVMRQTVRDDGTDDGLSYYLNLRREGGAEALGEEGIEGVIKRDVVRTFQDWDLFQRKEDGAYSMGQDCLAEVLLSLSREKSIHYTQGMNYMAAIMLQVCLSSAGEDWLRRELSWHRGRPLASES